MLDPGTRAPTFELPDHAGRLHRLEEALEQGSLLLYFYPFDFTPTCTREACMYRDRAPELTELGIQIWGVNSRGSRSHRAFRNWLGLGFPLLVDADREVARSYEALAPLGLYVRRVSYWIGEDGRIRDRASGDFSLREHRKLLERIAGGKASGEAPEGLVNPS